MGRFYEITLTPAPTQNNPSPAAVQKYSSYPNGSFDPGALNVQMDLLASVMAVPMGNSTITVDGVSLADLFQAQQYAGMQITVKGGMGPNGLPLANPSQRGLLLQGMVYQSFGNWVGTDQNINFVVVPSTYTFGNPANFVLDCPPGQSLELAISNMLATAYPNSPVIFRLGGSYVYNYNVRHVVQTLGMMAQWLKQFTGSANSPGIDLAMKSDGSILVTDHLATAPSPIKLAFVDLIGQPKWVDSNIMQFTTVMRADIQVGDLVLMPVGLQNAPGIVQTAGSSLPSSLKYKTSFKGRFVVEQVRHIGNFRDPDGASWVSIFQAAAVDVG